MTKAVLEAEGEGAAPAHGGDDTLTVPCGSLKLASLVDARGSTSASAQPRRQHRVSGRRSDRKSFLHALHWRRWRAEVRGGQTGSALDRLIQRSRLAVSAGRAAARRATCSSMRWYGTPPMARCCGTLGARFTPASPAAWRGRIRPDRREPAGDPGASYYTEAGLIEKAAALWGKAGRWLNRSALTEAAAQLARALEQFARCPARRN